MTIEEKVGQLLVFGFDALTLNDHAIKMIKDYKIGNVILFARNVLTPKQLFELNKNLQRLAIESIGIPLLITIDQEGGMVTRIKNGATFFPGAMTIGASHNKNNSYLTGKYMGEELKALGINMNLAPSLDINNNPNNPVIGVRSYGDNSCIVTEYGLEMIKGLQENVIATAKHFPGHGDTFVDSHLDLPKIEKSREELDQLELIPFKEAIKNGVKAIMSAHINFPALTEEGLPTTLSYRCLTGLLRNELGFDGLIITDCMQMKAIQTYYTTKKGALMAIKAGADLVMVSHSEELQIQAYENLIKAYNEADLTESLIDEKVARILKFKEENIDINLSLNYEDVSFIVENSVHKDFALDVVRQGMTLVTGELYNPNLKTLIIASAPLSTTIADENDGDDQIIPSIKKSIPKMDTYEISVNPNNQEINEVISIAKEYDQVVFCSYNANIYKSQLELIRELNILCNLHVIAMRNPFDSYFEPTIKNLIVLYEYTPNSVKVLIEYLQGKIVPKGILPVKL
jgi:beta-N-acetylhexosaminidase